MKTLMVIGAGPLQLPAFDEARSLGLRIVALDRNPDAPGMRRADVARVVDTRDADGAVRVAREEHVDGVMTLCTDFPVRTVAAVAHALGLPGLDPGTALRATHKGRMRDAFAAAGAPHPGYRRVDNLTDAQAAVTELGLPVIFKPTSSSGSRGIFKLTRLDMLEAAFLHATSVEGPGNDILVEEFVDGPEVSVEMVSWRHEHHLVAITDKVTTGDPHWVELGHSQPAQLSSETRQAVVACAVAGLAALKIDNSPSHVEIKVGAGGPVLIEIGPRLGGDYISTELTPLSTGVNLTRAAIRLALGQEPDLCTSHSRAAAIRYLVLPPGGLVTAVRGIEACRAVPGVIAVEVDVAPGSRIRAITASGDRAGHVIAVGAHAQEAIAAAERATRCIGIETTSVAS